LYLIAIDIQRKKGKIAIVEFTNYAIIWRDQLVTSKWYDGERSIDTWKEMKTIMRKKFVPNHYYREVDNILQSLSHGSKSVYLYFKEDTNIHD
jgi:hypothetical protein